MKGSLGKVQATLNRLQEERLIEDLIEAQFESNLFRNRQSYIGTKEVLNEPEILELIKERFNNLILAENIGASKETFEILELRKLGNFNFEVVEGIAKSVQGYSQHQYSQYLHDVISMLSSLEQEAVIALPVRPSKVDDQTLRLDEDRMKVLFEDFRYDKMQMVLYVKLESDAYLENLMVYLDNIERNRV